MEFIKEERPRVKLSKRLPCRAIIHKGDMEISVGWHFGKMVTLKRIENVARENPGMKWAVEIDGELIERDNSKEEWYEAV